MSVRRVIEIECKSGDGATLTMSDPLPGLLIASIGRSTPVHVSYKDARELAAWLIEHAAEDPDQDLVRDPRWAAEVDRSAR
jgi:hypothetical protein